MPAESDIKDVYELLGLVRKRPGMYMGRRSFERLLGFVDGLTFAKEPLADGDPPFYEFSRWITAKVEGMSITLPWEWMEQSWGSERAFEAFFEFLEEYKACVLTEVAVAVEYPLVPSFRFGDGRPVPLPKRLFVGQYAPSNVFFLGEEYESEPEASQMSGGVGGRISKEFPYKNSAAEVIEHACHRWSIPTSAWRSALR